MSLVLSLRSETLKLKRTLSIYLCVLGAAFGPFMSFMDNLTVDQYSPHGAPWSAHFLSARPVLTGILMPLYVILICALLLQIEYKEKTWKQVLTSPQRMIDIFLAKFISLQWMIVLFLICNNVFLTITAFVLEGMHPQLYNGPVNFYAIWIGNVQSWVLLLAISSIQFWLSLRFRNFIAPLAIGVAAWFLGPMLVFQFKVAAAEYYPYAFTIVGVFKGYEAKTVDYQWYSMFTAVVFLSIAFLEFKIRKVRA
jgi:lantibiotic transport system permease protein